MPLVHTRRPPRTRPWRGDGAAARGHKRGGSLETEVVWADRTNRLTTTIVAPRMRCAALRPPCRRDGLTTLLLDMGEDPRGVRLRTVGTPAEITDGEGLALIVQPAEGRHSARLNALLQHAEFERIFSRKVTSSTATPPMLATEHANKAYEVQPACSNVGQS